MSILLVNFSLVAQNLEGKVFMIQSNGVKAQGRVIEAKYEDLGKNGAKVQLWEKKGSPNQIWKFEDAGHRMNWYFIVNQSPKAGKCSYLEASWMTLGQDGGTVQLWEFNGVSKMRYGTNQIWQVTMDNDGAYRIISVHPKSNRKALEADSFTQQNNGSKIHLYFNENHKNQEWNLIEIN